MNRAQRREAQYKRGMQAMPHIYTEGALAPLYLLDRARPFSSGDTTTEHIKTREAFDRLKTGRGDEGDFDRVGMAVNLALVRAESIDDLLVQTMELAQDAMHACKARYLQRGRFGFDGLGLQAMTEAMDAHEAITDASSPQQMADALREVGRRILSKQAEAGA